MKKLKIYIILFIYLISSVGILVDFHYCGGELMKVTLYQTDEEGCCGEDEEKEADCCEDKYILVETDDSENFKTVTVEFGSYAKLIGPAYYESKIVDYNNVLSLKNLIPLNHAPPNGAFDPIFLKNGILRI